MSRNHGFQVGAWFVDPMRQRIVGEAEDHHVEPRIMQVLERLAAQPGEIVTREELLDAVWRDVVVNEDALTRAVSELRKVFGDDARRPCYIETIRGVGYRLVASVTRAAEGFSLVTGSPPSNRQRLFPRASPGLAGVNRLVLFTLMAGLVLSTVVWLMLGWSGSSPTPSVLRAQPFTSFPGVERDVALSPDGNKVAYAGGPGYEAEDFDIYVKQPSAATPLRLTQHPSFESTPTWSPDGTTIAFIRSSRTDAGIYAVPVLGGPARRLAETDRWVWGLDWSPEGRYLALSQPCESGGVFCLYRLSLETLEIEAITRTPGAVVRGHQPVFSPDGRWIAFLRSRSVGGDQIFVIPAKGGAPQHLVTMQAPVRGLDWLPDGEHLLFSDQYADRSNLWQLSVRDGKLVPVQIPARIVKSLSTARRSEQFVYEEETVESNLFHVEVAVQTGLLSPPVPFMASTRWDSEAAYSPDGNRVAFVSSRSGHMEIWIANQDETRPVQVTAFEGPFVGSPRWSPDGRHLAFQVIEGSTSVLDVVPAAGGRPRPATDASWNVLMSSWSRDGQWIYFASDHSGSWEIWKIPSEGGAPIQVTTAGGLVAYESPDGAHLYYTKPEQDGIWRRPVSGGAEACFLKAHQRWAWGNWAVTDGGIYYVDRVSDQLAYYAFDSGATRLIAEIPELYNPSLSVSPDGTSMLYAQVVSRGSDIMVVE